MVRLDDYRTFGRSGLRISPCGLGGGGFGSIDDDAATAVFRRYVELGGNFIDTAEIYGFFGKSEAWLGREIESAGLRDQLVVATKFGPNTGATNVNASGAGRKNIHRALAGSLERLRTDHVDLYWLHVWDPSTPAEELVETMDGLVASGRILYYGLSNVPAWYAAQVATIAQSTGRAGPIGLQLEYSLAQRTSEREHLPAARALGLGVAGYSPLAEGFLTGKYRRADEGFEGDGRLERQRRSSFPFQRSLGPHHWAILDAVIQSAEALQLRPADLALGWVASRPGVTLLLGASNVDQLNANLEGLGADIPADVLERLDAVSAEALTNPYDMFTADFRIRLEQGFKIRPWAS